MTGIEKVILADPRDMISVRTAEPDECRELGLPLGQDKLVFVFTSPDGNQVLHPADGVTVMLKQDLACITSQPASRRTAPRPGCLGRGSAR